jgi:hypothetical protein
MSDNPARWDGLKAMGFETPKELQPLSNMAFLTLLKRMNATPKGEKPDPDATPRWHACFSARGHGPWIQRHVQDLG